MIFLESWSVEKFSILTRQRKKDFHNSHKKADKTRFDGTRLEKLKNYFEKQKNLPNKDEITQVNIHAVSNIFFWEKLLMFVKRKFLQILQKKKKTFLTHESP